MYKSIKIKFLWHYNDVSVYYKNDKNAHHWLLISKNSLKTTTNIDFVDKHGLHFT